MLYELILINEIEQRAKIIFLSVVKYKRFKCFFNIDIFINVRSSKEGSYLTYNIPWLWLFFFHE